MNELISFDGNNLRLTLPDVSTWATIDWVILFGVIGAVYGIVTHLASLRGVRKHNRTAGACDIADAHAQCNEGHKQITNGMLIAALFGRVTLQLWWRFCLLAIGLIGLPILSIATFKIRLWNTALSKACKWYMKPAELWETLGSGGDESSVTIKLKHNGKEAKLKGSHEAAQLLRAMSNITNA